MNLLGTPACWKTSSGTPALYWGNSANHFHSFVAFICGYQFARCTLPGSERRLHLDQAIPPGFTEFVTEHFGHDFPHGSHGWTSLIEENSKSDREALDLFLKLRQLCCEKGVNDGPAQ